MRIVFGNAGLVLAAVFLLVIAGGCRKDKQMQTAKGNAAQFGLARCACDKELRKDPPGDITLCSEQMQQARRYLSINMEFGKFNQAQRDEIVKHSEDIYNGCMNSPDQPR